MSISAEEKNRYLRETAIVLAREGFHTDRTDMWHNRAGILMLPPCFYKRFTKEIPTIPASRQES